MIKKFSIGVALLLLYSFLPAQEALNRDLPAFSRLVAGDKVMVRLIKGDRESVSIKTQGIDASAVKTEVTDRTLSLSIYGEAFTKKKVLITLTYVKLDAITVNGGAEVSTVSLFKADTLTVELKSGGMLYLDADIGFLTGKVLEGAILTAEGYATEQDMVVATSGTLSAYELESDTVKVKASSGGKAKIFVEEKLDAEASSKGYISYKGTPAILNRNVTTGGTLSVYQP
jgi:hypothetical protein